MSARGFARRLGDAAFCASPLLPIFRRRTAGRIAVLAYHDVREPRAFAAQIRYLRERMNPVSLDEVLEAMRWDRPMDDRSVLVTFDDADPTVHSDGAGILRQFDVPATVFVISDLVGTETPFWWREVEALVGAGATAPGVPSTSAAAALQALKSRPEAARRESLAALRRSRRDLDLRTPQLGETELRDLCRAGFTIGNHTRSHPCLVRCTPSEVEVEIEAAHDRLTRIFGVAPRSFAYPNGDVHPAADAILARLGYEAAFLFDHRHAGNPPAEPYRISRLRVNSTTSMHRFRLIVHGLHPALHHRRFDSGSPALEAETG